MDVINYPDVALATIFYNRKTSDTWNQFVEPKHAVKLSRDKRADGANILYFPSSDNSFALFEVRQASQWQINRLKSIRGS